MNELTQVPQSDSEAQKNEPKPSAELQARIAAVQKQIDILQRAAKEGAVIPKGMALHRAVFKYDYASINGDSQLEVYHPVAFVLLPSDALAHVDISNVHRVRITGDETGGKPGSSDLQWRIDAGSEAIFDRTYYLDAEADEILEKQEADEEPQWYEGPDGILTPFAVGLSAEEAVMAYKAVHPDDQSSESCPICAQVGGYCGHS